MRNKLIYCIPLALSITCLIGCASKAAQTPADPEAATMLPSQEQQAIVPKDTKGKMLFTPQQSEHENTPMRAAESVVTDAPVIAKTGVTQAAPEPTTAPSNPSQDIPSATVHAKTGYVEPEPEPTPEPDPAPVGTADRQAAMDAANAYAVTTYGRKPYAGQQRLPLPGIGTSGRFAGYAGGQGAGHGGLHLPSVDDAGRGGQHRRCGIPVQCLHHG